jgi:small-conductance mechanosensitive channel
MTENNSAVLKAIQDLRSDVIGELQSQRALWGEAEATLLAQGKLHRERLDAHQLEIEQLKEDIENEAEERDTRVREARKKLHDLRNKITPQIANLEMDVDDLRKRVAALEHPPTKPCGPPDE